MLEQSSGLPQSPLALSDAQYSALIGENTARQIRQSHRRRIIARIKSENSAGDRDIAER